MSADKKNRREPTRSFAVRLTPSVLQKLRWKAMECGTDMSEFVRRLIADAVKTAKPPADAPDWGIQASDAERRAWADLAADVGEPLDECVRKILNSYVRQRFGTAPRLKDGKMIWRRPE